MCGGGGSSNSSGGRGRGGYGAGNRTREQAANLADSQDGGSENRDRESARQRAAAQSASASKQHNTNNTGQEDRAELPEQYSQRRDIDRNRRSTFSPDVVDRGYKTDERYLEEDDPFSLSGKKGELKALKNEMSSAGIAPSTYADTGKTSLLDSMYERDEAHANLRNAVTDEYNKNELNSLSPIMESAVQAPDILSYLNLNTDEKTAIVRDLAHKEGNGLLGKAANFIPVPLAGAVVNGVMDSGQANQYSKDIWKEGRSTSERFADGAQSFGRNAISGSFPGLIGMALKGPLEKAMAPSIANYGKPIQPVNHDVGKNSDSSTTLIPPIEVPQAETASNGTGWDSSFGNYDSHLQNFKYNPNTAQEAWA